MSRRRVLPRAVIAAVLLVLPASADAPVDQYLAFDRDDVAITDNHTTLVWARAVARPAAAYANPGLKCPAPGRVPTVKELLTLVDEDPHQEYESSQVVTKLIDRQAFPNTPTDRPYWTLTPASATEQWAVDFGTGLVVKVSKGDTGYFRCLAK